jgi:Major Facilitator Superfamily
MTAVRAPVTKIIVSGRRMVWLPVAAVLLGTGWGANQFSPMLLVYRQRLGLSPGMLEAMFGVYALGLIPGLLLGGRLADARGRRTVVIPAAVLSLASSMLLGAGAYGVTLLFAGRLAAGISSGAVFGAGTAWLRELSRPPFGVASGPVAARRAAIAMTAGFALGPLVAGLLAQWAPAPDVLPYLPHIAVMAMVWAASRSVPETVTVARAQAAVARAQAAVARAQAAVVRAGSAGRTGLVRSTRFRRVVAPMAPWVFTAPAIAFALLPSVVGAGQASDGIALTAAITALCPLAGVAVQPLARRLDGRGRRNHAAIAGLLVLVAGLALGAVTAAGRQTWLLAPCAVVLGGAYGLCLVAGLIEIQGVAGQRGQAALTAAYYALAYLGFAAPYLFVLAAHLASYSVLLGAAAVLALATTALVARRSVDADGETDADGERDGHVTQPPGEPRGTVPRAGRATR